MTLEFMRSKLVNVTRKDAETLAVHGVLDDSIYSLELDFRVRIRDLEVFAVSGRWHRWTTPECPRALEFLDLAEGFHLDDEIGPRIHKSIGRRACRHFANLFLECVYAVRQTVAASKRHEAEASAAPAAVNDGPAPETASAENGRELSGPRPGEFLVELHLHTFPASPCASDPVAAMIEAAKARGLDALCLTDHNYVWDAGTVAALREKHAFPILRGNEIVTDQGDMLVFGFDEEIRGVIGLAALKQRVAAAGGVVLAAHPFRGFLTFGAEEVGLSVAQAGQREMFKWVDGIEGLNGRVTAAENRLAREVAAALGLPVTGGSDAHAVAEVGLYATAFPEPIDDEQSLVAALRAGRGRPVVLRGRENAGN